MKSFIKLIIYIFYYIVISRFQISYTRLNSTDGIQSIGLFSFREIKNTNNAGDASITEFVSLFGEVLNQKSVYYNNMNKFLTRNKRKNCELYVVRDLISFVIFDSLRRLRIVEATLIYYATDVFYKRIDSKQIFLKKWIRVFTTKKIEEVVWKNADYVFANRTDEMEIISKLNKKVSLVPAKSRPPLNLAITLPSEKQPLSFIFVGASGNVPNRTSIANFIEKYWEGILLNYPRSTLKIVGKGWDNHISVKQGIVLTGFLSVAELSQVYGESHFAIGFLEYGAGVKGKILEAMQYQTIVLGNEVGFEGIDCHALKPFFDLDSLITLIKYYLKDENYKYDLVVYDKFLRNKYSKILIVKKIKKSLEELYGNRRVL